MSSPNRTRRIMIGAMAAAPFASHLGVARGSAFPARGLTLIVPGPPGSGSDVIARLLADDFAAAWKQPVTVENRAGASGTLAAKQLLRAAPDGLTIMLGHIATHSIVPSLMKPAPYDPLADFAAISMAGTTSNILVVSSKQNIRSVADLIDYGKKKGEMNYGSPGIGLTQHFDGFQFSRTTGLSMRHVPYKGTTPALIDLTGGHIDMMFATPPAAKSLIERGELRPIAQTAPQRMKTFPDLPTFRELDMPDLVSASWWGLFAPAGTPENILETINAQANATLAREDVRQKLLTQYVEAVASASPADFRNFLSGDIKRWARRVEESGIRLN